MRIWCNNEIYKSLQQKCKIQTKFLPQKAKLAGVPSFQESPVRLCLKAGSQDTQPTKRVRNRSSNLPPTRGDQNSNSSSQENSFEHLKRGPAGLDFRTRMTRSSKSRISCLLESTQEDEGKDQLYGKGRKLRYKQKVLVDPTGKYSVGWIENLPESRFSRRTGLNSDFPNTWWMIRLKTSVQRVKSCHTESERLTEYGRCMSNQTEPIESNRSIERLTIHKKIEKKKDKDEHE